MASRSAAAAATPAMSAMPSSPPELELVRGKAVGAGVVGAGVVVGADVVGVGVGRCVGLQQSLFPFFFAMPQYVDAHGALLNA